MKIINKVCSLFFLLSVTHAGLSQQGFKMPYERSKYIIACEIDPVVTSYPDHVERAGDNWPVTWSDDDNLYTFLGDGRGFGPLAQSYSRYPCKIKGNPYEGNIIGYDITTNSVGIGTGGDVKGKKVSGLISVPDPVNPSGTLLVAWVRNINAAGGASLMFSRDYGESWNWAWGDPDSVPEAVIPELGHPSWMQSGKNNGSAKDKYLYFYSPDQPKAYLLADNVIIGRVAATEVLDRSKYRYFSGTPGKLSWAKSIEKRRPGFIAEKQCYRLYVTYNPSLKRYFLLTANGDGFMTNYTSTHNLGIYESETPWGPWYTVYWNDSFHPEWAVFGPQMVPKWISEDGKAFYLLFSNFPKGPYKFNLQKVEMKVRE